MALRYNQVFNHEVSSDCIASRLPHPLDVVLQLHVLVELRRLGEHRLDGEEGRPDLLRNPAGLVGLYVSAADLVQQLCLPRVDVPRPQGPARPCEGLWLTSGGLL
jgi:hypothetical protein